MIYLLLVMLGIGGGFAGLAYGYWIGLERSRWLSFIDLLSVHWYIPSDCIDTLREIANDAITEGVNIREFRNVREQTLNTLRLEDARQ